MYRSYHKSNEILNLSMKRLKINELTKGEI